MNQKETVQTGGESDIIGDTKFSMKEDDHNGYVQNQGIRQKHGTDTGGRSTSESERRFHAEAERRGQVVRVFEAAYKYAGNRGYRLGRFTEITGDARSETAAEIYLDLGKISSLRCYLSGTACFPLATWKPARTESLLFT
jgi:hypothetical protein